MKRIIVLLSTVLLPLSLHAETVKTVLEPEDAFEPVPLESFAWQKWAKGYVTTDEGFVCDNGDSESDQRGLGKIVELNQTKPLPIHVRAESRAENASQRQSTDYSLYLDITYMDGTNRWGVIASFSGGTHDWEEQRLTFVPHKPIKSVNCWLLFRFYKGRALFRNLVFSQAPDRPNVSFFDATPVANERPANGWILRDVKRKSPFVTLEEDGETMGIQAELKTTSLNGARIHTATLRAPDLKDDRILHLAYVKTLTQDNWQWLSFERPGRETALGEMSAMSHTGCGATGQNGTMPFAAVGNGRTGHALGMDFHTPAHGRVVYNGGTRELFVAYDVALTPENNTAVLKTVEFDFADRQGMRSAFSTFYGIYPEAFMVRIKKQGLWMAFAKSARWKAMRTSASPSRRGTMKRRGTMRMAF